MATNSIVLQTFWLSQLSQVLGSLAGCLLRVWLREIHGSEKNLDLSLGIAHENKAFPKYLGLENMNLGNTIAGA